MWLSCCPDSSVSVGIRLFHQVLLSRDSPALRSQLDPPRSLSCSLTVFFFFFFFFPLYRTLRPRGDFTGSAVLVSTSTGYLVSGPVTRSLGSGPVGSSSSDPYVADIHSC